MGIQDSFTHHFFFLFFFFFILLWPSASVFFGEKETHPQGHPHPIFLSSDSHLLLPVKHAITIAPFFSLSPSSPFPPLLRSTTPPTESPSLSLAAPFSVIAISRFTFSSHLCRDSNSTSPPSEVLFVVLLFGVAACEVSPSSVSSFTLLCDS